MIFYSSIITFQIRSIVNDLNEIETATNREDFIEGIQPFRLKIKELARVLGILIDR